eukprot:TRINITY_DN19092_c0_g1_i1.p1 TRINITY_DN19092_c0_g1~~TRINITY_DN19092_c0_g1_i1.p1  ORF type:complete len:222 (+),score=21.74 TRINITY_DN19092_c0_g1_i1:43-666(+)
MTSLIFAILLSISVPVHDSARPFDPRGYYLISPDYRACISPLCGGWWVSLANREKLRCSDRSEQEQCYAASIEPTSPSSDVTLVRGRLQPRDYGDFGVLGQLYQRQLFASSPSSSIDGGYYAVKNNGVVCITFPCFTYTEYELNSRSVQHLTGVDLSQIEDPDLVDRATSTLGSGSYLIVKGSHKSETKADVQEVVLVVSQVFFPTN